METVFSFLSTPVGILITVTFIFLLVMYIKAYGMSQRDEIIILSGKKDYYVLSLILIVSSITALLLKDRASEHAINILLIGSLVVIALTAYTIYLSYRANAGYPKLIFISICAKLFIVCIISLIFIIRAIELLLVDATGKKDKRFKDGTKGNVELKAHARNRKFTDQFVKELIK
ncbi:hypothetical protein [Pedobacter sp.]